MGEPQEQLQLRMIKEVFQTLQEHKETMDVLQTQLSLQKVRIDQQEGTIKELTAKVEELEKGAGKDGDASNSIWKGAEKLSIADAVKETAENALMTNLGFVMDPTSKLYCNYSTGYYYDPAQGLFYNGHTGTYYTYDADNQKYIFHSQVQLEASNQTRRSKKPKVKINTDLEEAILSESKKRSKQRKESAKPDKIKEEVGEINDGEDGEVEEGEISSSNEPSDDGKSESSRDSGGENCETGESSEDDEEFPPCIRAIVLESCSTEVKKGSLGGIITCMGGTLGRDGDNHAIILPDMSVEKLHADITYTSENQDRKGTKKKYFIKDVGSQYGTFLNGQRLSEPLQASEPHEVLHGSIIKIGNFSILIHIHDGTFTCGKCEPGLLMENETNNGSNNMYQNEKPKSRNALMKQIKKKYGIDKPRTSTDKLTDSDSYKDRAMERRIIKGSDNPYEKTQVTTTEESITESNKGFKMLAKMGWSSGTTLGNSGDKGLMEPINLQVKTDRAGLGMSAASAGMHLFTGSPKKLDLSSSSKSFSGKKSKNSEKSSFIPKHLVRAEQLAITIKRFKEDPEVKMEVDADEKS